jgi:AraC-like DNA-binding protein
MSVTTSPSLYRDGPDTLIESRRGVAGATTRLSLYEVNRAVDPTTLRSPHLFYYGVVAGKKVVHVDGESSLTCDPGDSLIVPPLQTTTVEFPEADRTPVRYVAMKVSQEQAVDILEDINEVALDSSVSRQWQVEEQKYCHVQRREGICRTLDMIAYLIGESPPNRDRLIDLNARELMIQLLQTRSRPLLVGDFSRHSSTGGLAAAIQYIQDNLDRHISINELVEEACMSKSTFYRHFSDEFDMSPLEYITRERIVRARELLADADNTVTSVSHELGFSSTSHFIDTFKEHEGMTPKQYQLEVTD